MANARAPRITRIVAPLITPGDAEFVRERKPLTSGPPGTLILLVGRGFGRDPNRVVVTFGPVALDPFPRPLFSETHLFVTVPQIAAGSLSVSVTVGGHASNALRFRVTAKPAVAGPPGALTRRFLTAVEALVALGTAENRIATFGKSFSPKFKKRVDEELPRMRAMLLLFRGLLDQLDRDRLAQLDTAIQDSRILPVIQETLLLLRKGGETEAGISMETHKKVYGGILDIIEGLGEGLGEEHLGGFFKGLSKILRGSVFMLYELEVQRKAAEDHEAQEREKERKEEEYRAKIEGKFDRVESKLDREEQKLDVQELKIDFVKNMVDRLEGKLDLERQMVDKLEGKSDKQEGKLDKVEAKLDQIQRNLDLLETKGDRLESKLDRFEPKIDKLGPKIDKLEPKIDKLEPKIDKLEPKIDRLEPKIDKVEPKLDQIQSGVSTSKEFWQFAPVAWRVRRARRVGVRVLGAPRPAGASAWAFNVESVLIPRRGVQVVKIIVDGVVTDVSRRRILSPSNVMIDSGLGVIGASRSVIIEFDTPYSGPVEFNGEKPQGLSLCTVVEGAGASQKSPSPCRRP